MQSAVLSSSIPNAFALPGGRSFCSTAAREGGKPRRDRRRAAHELGHLSTAITCAGPVYNGGTRSLIGLLFGISPLDALIFGVSHAGHRSHSREAEQDADTFRSTDAELGRYAERWANCCSCDWKRGRQGLSILSAHPLTEDRLRG